MMKSNFVIIVQLLQAKINSNIPNTNDIMEINRLDDIVATETIQTKKQVNKLSKRISWSPTLVNIIRKVSQ